MIINDTNFIVGADVAAMLFFPAEKDTTTGEVKVESKAVILMKNGDKIEIACGSRIYTKALADLRKEVKDPTFTEEPAEATS